MNFSATDGPNIQVIGRKALKKPNPVYLVKVGEPFKVHTNEGILNAQAGDFVAYDPIWPVAASYIEQHYTFQD